MPPKRRAVYFAYQGLLMAVILLLFLYQGPTHSGWRLTVLISFLFGSMTLLRVVSDATLARSWFQAGLFLGDALLATVILSS